jgi:hypothetical protein
MQSRVIVQVFHLYDVEFSMCEVLRVLDFHLSWYEVTVVRFDAMVWSKFGMVETVRFHQVLWLVMLESTKDWILEVETLEKQVLPRVWYGTTYLLIMDAMRSVPSSDEWEVTWSFAQAHMVLQGSWYHILPRETLAKPGIWPIINICNNM